MVLGGMPGPVNPHLHRWMMFVDGENSAIQAKSFANAENFALVEGPLYLPDVFVWIPGVGGRKGLDNTNSEVPTELRPQAVRSFYYTTVAGDEARLNQVKQALHDLQFQSEVFKKPSRERKTKAVDISLATDMLSHAFNDSFDTAMLVAGDGDYVPLVNQVKRAGKRVYVTFFPDGFGINKELVLASDMYLNLGPFFRDCWVRNVEGSSRRGAQEAAPRKVEG